MTLSKHVIILVASIAASPAIASIYEKDGGSAQEKVREDLPDQLPSIFSKITSTKPDYDAFCHNGVVDPGLFVGEVVTRYGVNPVEISTAPIGATSTAQLPFVDWLLKADRCDYALGADFDNPKKCQGWIVNRRSRDNKPLRKDVSFALVQARGHLSNFVVASQTVSTKSFYVEFAADAVSQKLRRRANDPIPTASESIEVSLTRALFTKPGKGARISIKCPAFKQKQQPKQSKFFSAVRSKPEDLVVPRTNSKGVVLDKFKSLKPATASYENNAEKGVRTASVEFTAGVGRVFRDQEYAMGFVTYKFQKTDSDDDDDDKTIHTVTPGLLYSREFSSSNFGPFSYFGGYYGGSVRSTIDVAQDSETLKLNIFTRGFVLDFEDRKGAPICGGRNAVFGLSFLSYNCDATMFAEVGHVFDAGSSVALFMDDDDQYIGLGGIAELEFTIDGIPVAKTIGFRTAYRHMQIVSGALDDQTRFESALKYELDSGLSIEFSYEEGQDVESFQDEEKFKISLGYKY